MENYGNDKEKKSEGQSSGLESGNEVNLTTPQKETLVTNGSKDQRDGKGNKEFSQDVRESFDANTKQGRGSENNDDTQNAPESGTK